MTPLPPPRTPLFVHLFLVIGAVAAALLVVDGRRGRVLGGSERGDVERAADAPSARGAAVYVWGGGGYQGGK